MLTAPDAYESVKAALTAAGHAPALAEITMRAENDIAVAGDTALDVVAAGFGRARDADATRSFGMFSCSKATNEMNYLAQKLARQVMGSNNIDSCNRT